MFEYYGDACNPSILKIDETGNSIIDDIILIPTKIADVYVDVFIIHIIKYLHKHYKENMSKWVMTDNGKYLNPKLLLHLVKTMDIQLTKWYVQHFKTEIIESIEIDPLFNNCENNKYTMVKQVINSFLK